MDTITNSTASVPTPFAPPPDYVGPLALPGTGREVWWTGRVAIGLRYQRELACERSQSGLWIQRVMLAGQRGRA